MPGLEFRYVGQDRLPPRSSDFDVERYFALTDSDIAALNERFWRDRRAGAAIQLVFLRASGRTLDHVGTLPRQLLRYIDERLGLPTPTIASLRTLYQRQKNVPKNPLVHRASRVDDFNFLYGKDANAAGRIVRQTYFVSRSSSSSLKRPG
jgi:hypothetical protein